MSDAITSSRSYARLIIAAILLVLIVAAISFFMRGDDEEAEKLELGVLTSMPIFWPEGDVSDSLKAGGEMSPVNERLSQAFDLVPVDSWKTVTEQKLSLLMLAQSRALTPGELDKLDRWVRLGGKALILADPALRWESSYPLGDQRRPLFTSMLSPILTHWGLELALPIGEQEDSSVLDLDGYDIVTSAPGIWEQVKLDGNCAISNAGLVATCEIGKGRAILLADADILDPQYWHGPASVLSDGDVADNMDWVEETLLELAE